MGRKESLSLPYPLYALRKAVRCSKAYADSVRAVRAENNGVNPALSKSTKVTNPFENMDILNMINAKIKELANVPIPNIADYKLVNEKVPRNTTRSKS